MRNVSRLVLPLLVVTAWTGWAQPATPAEPWDALLRNTEDQRISLAQLRGRPTVLIYEDRHSLEINRTFKNALRARALEPRGADVQVVAVANVARFNFFPVRGFALHSVREAEKKAQHPILVDWEDVLARPPWNLPRNNSSVLVLSPAGEVIFRHSGPLTEQEQQEVFTLLEGLIPQAPSPAQSSSTTAQRGH